MPLQLICRTIQRACCGVGGGGGGDDVDDDDVDDDDDDDENDVNDEDSDMDIGPEQGGIIRRRHLSSDDEELPETMESDLETAVRVQNHIFDEEANSRDPEISNGFIVEEEEPVELEELMARAETSWRTGSNDKTTAGNWRPVPPECGRIDMVGSPEHSEEEELGRRRNFCRGSDDSSEPLRESTGSLGLVVQEMCSVFGSEDNEDASSAMSVAALGALTHSPSASDDAMADLDDGGAHLHGFLGTHGAVRQGGATEASSTLPLDIPPDVYAAMNPSQKRNYFKRRNKRK